MKKPLLNSWSPRLIKLPLLIFMMTLNLFVFAQVASDYGPTEVWNKKYGGPGDDWITTTIKTLDGGFLLGGSSDSTGRDKTANSKGGFDFWIVKTDSLGNKQWDKTFGGPGRDNLTQIIQTSDGYILFGTYDSEIGGDKTETSRGGIDFWAVKISFTGNKIWDKRYGGSNDDNFSQATPTPDGGFILAGSSSSPISGDKSSNLRSKNPATFDYWIIKINSVGNKVWDKSYGGNQGEDKLAQIVATKEGGYLLAGVSNSSKGFEKSESSNYQWDYSNLIYNLWLIKIDEVGMLEWEKTYLADFPNTIS